MKRVLHKSERREKRREQGEKYSINHLFLVPCSLNPNANKTKVVLREAWNFFGSGWGKTPDTFVFKSVSSPEEKNLFLFYTISEADDRKPFCVSDHLLS